MHSALLIPPLSQGSSSILDECSEQGDTEEKPDRACIRHAGLDLHIISPCSRGLHPAFVSQVYQELHVPGEYCCFYGFCLMLSASPVPGLLSATAARCLVKK